MKSRDRKKKPGTKKVTKKTTAKKTTKKTKATGMNPFEQCIVLAAIVNQQRNKDKKFLFIPLPDINSTALAPLRELLGEFDFTATDIMKAAHEILSSATFKECFALQDEFHEAILKLKEKTHQELMMDLFTLAGPEAKKMIYMAEKDAHDIQKTTLEKHALKMGLIEPHFIEPETFQQQDHQRKIIIKLNFNKFGKGFTDSNQRFSGKQRRGRG